MSDKTTSGSYVQSEQIARITDDGRVQPLKDHLQNVVRIAGEFAQAFGCTQLAEAAGDFHDFGKATEAFQSYIRNPNGKRGSVKHSIHGAKTLYDKCSMSGDFWEMIAAELLSNVIASHHGELHDNLSPDGNTKLIDDLKSTEEPVMPFDAEVKLPELVREISRLLERAPDKPFALTMLTKMLFSCLVDADRLDAYLFEANQEYITPEKPNWDGLLGNLSNSLSKYRVLTEMDSLRTSVSEQCAEAGKVRSCGVYKLEVPTGGGKTLASLRFALEHAKKHNLDRIIYVIPYLSILSQTAKEIQLKLSVGDDIILEHHSNILPDDPEYYKLHTDRWDAPIIITTQVQFLESVFSARGSDLRKLHSMCNSVMIFDEVQSIPLKCIHLFNAVVNFFTSVCGTTALLCTATQPLLDQVERPLILTDKQSIAIVDNLPMRTTINNAVAAGGQTYPELASFVIEKHRVSTLTIVNTKAAAKSLYLALREQGVEALHLSTNMCQAHRDDVIARLRMRLAQKQNVICVSTQLIEAGVDISFECVIRDVAGLDSIYQAAGRCNRHGEYGEVKDVYVVKVAGENLDKLSGIKAGAEVTMRLYNEQNLDIDCFYRYYFFDRRMQMDYPLKPNGSILDLLTCNQQGRSANMMYRGCKNQVPLTMAIRSAAKNFYVIDRGRKDVVVPYIMDGVIKVDELMEQLRADISVTEKRGVLRELCKYTISLYKYQLHALEHKGALSCDNGVQVLAKGFYDSVIGVDIEGNHEFLCV